MTNYKDEVVPHLPQRGRLRLRSKRKSFDTALPLARQWRCNLHIKAGHELRYAKLAPVTGQ
ncbi:MAG: hypothetical protein EOO61_17480 [Hymenobacter sp.]|nr:MAG: hypothetical protein EOO61_17480 [Hymenobacter sp.]